MIPKAFVVTGNEYGLEPLDDVKVTALSEATIKYNDLVNSGDYGVVILYKILDNSFKEMKRYINL